MSTVEKQSMKKVMLYEIFLYLNCKSIQLEVSTLHPVCIIPQICVLKWQQLKETLLNLNKFISRFTKWRINKMYKYELHMHTSPVSKCANASVRDSLQFYKSKGYDGVFITNHFLDGNINIDINEPYEKKINFYFSDYEAGLEIGREIGIKVFCGIETSYRGTDFLVYGLDKEWFLKNSKITNMMTTEKLSFFHQNNALIIQAHPFREAGYIDHIRLYPRHVDGIEVINANRTELENRMARIYAENYNLLQLAGSDNHIGENAEHLAGVKFDQPISSVDKFITLVKENKAKIFTD